MNGFIRPKLHDPITFCKKGEITPEQASVVVGKKLYEKFIPQVTENAPPVPTMSYEDYYKQFGASR